jgi:glycosyltransferase involved in cell wall biosynthesis
MLVSCITPITESRRHFVPVIDSIISRQTYPHIEHIYLWGDGTIGDKRNKACEQAKGDIILHIDSDDMYSDDWVELQVSTLLSTCADICGLKIKKPGNTDGQMKLTGWLALLCVTSNHSGAKSHSEIFM